MVRKFEDKGKSNDESWKKRNTETGPKKIRNLIISVHVTTKISDTEALRGR